MKNLPPNVTCWWKCLSPKTSWEFQNLMRFRSLFHFLMRFWEKPHVTWHEVFDSSWEFKKNLMRFYISHEISAWGFTFLMRFLHEVFNFSYEFLTEVLMRSSWGAHEELMRTSMRTSWGPHEDLNENLMRTSWGPHEDLMRTSWGPHEIGSCGHFLSYSTPALLA